LVWLAEQSGGKARRLWMLPAGKESWDVAEAPAPEVANRVPALCNLVVDAETPEAAPDQALFKKLPGIHGVSRGSVLRCSPSLAGAILL
jgi:hypothetical protein